MPTDQNKCETMLISHLPNTLMGAYLANVAGERHWEMSPMIWPSSF